MKQTFHLKCHTAEFGEETARKMGLIQTVIVLAEINTAGIGLGPIAYRPVELTWKKVVPQVK